MKSGHKHGALRVLLLFLVASGLCTSRLAAQQGGIAAGISSYHLRASGHGLVVGGYLRWPLNRSLALLGSISHLTDHTTLETQGIRFTETLRMLFPEARVEITAHWGRLSPFAGAGGGLGIGFGSQFGGFTLHAIGGARLALSTRMTIATAMVARAVDPGRGRTLDALIGVEWTRERK